MVEQMLIHEIVVWLQIFVWNREILIQVEGNNIFEGQSLLFMHPY